MSKKFNKIKINILSTREQFEPLMMQL